MPVNVSEFLAALEKKRFRTKHAGTIQEAREYLLSQIGEGASVGVGGSITIKEIGIAEALEARGNTVYWHWFVPAEKTYETREKARVADAYLCSTNAASMDGAFFNIDGAGNRVASIAYGKQPLFIVMGTNKLTDTREAAMERAQNIAAPLNAKRLKLSTPCVATGVCADCSSPQRICNVKCILERPAGNREVHVVVVDEELGL